MIDYYRSENFFKSIVVSLHNIYDFRLIKVLRFSQTKRLKIFKYRRFSDNTRYFSLLINDIARSLCYAAQALADCLILHDIGHKYLITVFSHFGYNTHSLYGISAQIVEIVV